MSETTEAITLINASNSESLVGMLKSADADSRTLAFEVIEGSDIMNSQVEILCILKGTYDTAFKGRSMDKEFTEAFPKLAKFLTDTLGSDASNVSELTFRKLYEVTMEVGKPDSTKFLIDMCTDEFRDALEGFGFDFLKYLDIHFTIKDKASA